MDPSHESKYEIHAAAREGRSPSKPLPPSPRPHNSHFFASFLHRNDGANYKTSPSPIFSFTSSRGRKSHQDRAKVMQPGRRGLPPPHPLGRILLPPPRRFTPPRPCRLRSGYPGWVRLDPVDDCIQFERRTRTTRRSRRDCGSITKQGRRC